ncbi:IS1 family transposase [Leptolyngbya sp. CCNP1308]|uniref:IS1 family transposase n=1 Tax=Leptolyngbya sp. CCNP1308 TaxID=3110255 RepID=UPI002B20E56F|nr:IS1 family transposase [Leptolyngbya sp. CCNP1308]MEA5451941.1 IS1 family transposase [Leptolyngbya sp. CCNP1308]
MQCPECGSQHIRKNGHRGDQQNYIWVKCYRQCIKHYDPDGYSDDVKRLCIRMYVNGMGFRSMSRVTGIVHTSLLNWVKQVGEHLPEAYGPEEIPQVGELDELETFVGQRKNKVWIWTAVDHFRAGILGWVIGDHSAQTFQLLWQTIEFWQCYFWVSDGYPVYPQFIPEGDQIVSKTYMTRVKGENTRLRHYLARLHRKTLCYSKSLEMLKHSVRLLIHYLKFGDVPVPA